MKFYISDNDESCINFLDFTDLKDTTHYWDLNYLYACIEYLQIDQALKVDAYVNHGNRSTQIDVNIIDANDFYQLESVINHGTNFLNNYFNRYRNSFYYQNTSIMKVLENNVIGVTDNTKLMISEQLGPLSKSISAEYKRFLTYSLGEALPFYIMHKFKSNNNNFSVVKLKPSQNSPTPDFLLYDTPNNALAIWECKGTVDSTNEYQASDEKNDSDQLNKFVNNLYPRSVIRSARLIYSKTRVPFNLRIQANKELEMSIADPETLITYQPVTILLDELFFIAVCIKSNYQFEERKNFDIPTIKILINQLLSLEEPKEMLVLKNKLRNEFKHSKEPVDTLKSNNDYLELLKFQEYYDNEIDKIIKDDTFEKIEQVSNSYKKQLILYIKEQLNN